MALKRLLCSMPGGKLALGILLFIPNRSTFDQLLFSKKTIRLVWHHAFSVLILIAIISGFDYVLFALVYTIR